MTLQSRNITTEYLTDKGENYFTLGTEKGTTQNRAVQAAVSPMNFNLIAQWEAYGNENIVSRHSVAIHPRGMQFRSYTSNNGEIDPN